MSAEFDLRLLDEEPPTPSTVDVQRAVADGRRRRARRGAGYAGAATLTVFAVVGASVAAGGLFTGGLPVAGPPVASGSPKAYTIPGTAWKAPAATAPTGCTLERLPVPDNAPMALTAGADPSGRYIVGRSYPKGGGYQAVIWHDGKATKVMMPGDEEELLKDVNSTGTAVGWSYQGTDPVPYVYRDGQVSQLPGVSRGSALAINDAGAIVGDDSAGAPLVWPSATAQPIRLPLPAGASAAAANDIDEDGTVVGTIDRKLPYVWFADGTHRALPLPTLEGKPAVSARVFSIRNGWATGLASTSTDPEKGMDPGKNAMAGPIRWNVRTGEVRVFGELAGRASTANAQGWLIGTDKQGRAALATGTAVVPLAGLSGHQPGGLSDIPTTLSDDGRVISGQSDDASGTIQAVVWRCQ